MGKVFHIDCKDVGIDCEFAVTAATVEKVIELCAEHGRSNHDMHSFSPALFAKMRGCVRIVEEDSPAVKAPGRGD
jgi:predicted small metal-binding protein